MSVIAAVIERIAPHWPVEDEAEDGPDTRGFIERLHAADMHRSENPRTLWASNIRKVPYYEILSCVQVTQPGFGIDLSWQDGGDKGRKFGYPSRVDLMIALGPWSICFSSEWNYPESGS